MANQDFNNAIKMTRLNSMRVRLRSALARQAAQAAVEAMVGQPAGADSCTCPACMLRRAMESGLRVVQLGGSEDSGADEFPADKPAKPPRH